MIGLRLFKVAAAIGATAAVALLSGCGSTASTMVTNPDGTSSVVAERTVPRANGTVRRVTYVEAAVQAAPSAVPTAFSPSTGATSAASAASASAAAKRQAAVKQPVKATPRGKAAADASARAASSAAQAQRVQLEATLNAFAAKPGLPYVYVIEMDGGPVVTLAFKADQGLATSDRVLVSDQTVTAVR